MLSEREGEAPYIPNDEDKHAQKHDFLIMTWPYG
jgi:hypothetical protein